MKFHSAKLFLSALRFVGGFLRSIFFAPAGGFVIGFGFFILSFRKFGVWCGIALFLIQYPPDSTPQRFQVFGVGPNCFVMAKADVENFSFSVFAAPSDRHMVR